MAAILIILDVFVGILALLGLVAVWDQVWARRRTAGTKGVVLVSERLQPRRRNIARFQATLRIVGPVVRYEVALDLEADGTRFEASPAQPAPRPSMGCDDEELSWTFEVSDDDVERLWVVASWVEARGHDLRTVAIARRLGTSETYVWKWYLGRLGGWRRQRTAMAAPAALPAVRSPVKDEQG